MVVFRDSIVARENLKLDALIPGTKSITLFMAVTKKQERLTTLIW